MRELMSWILAAIFLSAVGLGVGALSDKIFADLSGEAALGWLTFIATTWFAIWSFNKTKRKEAEAQLFPEKARVYKEIIDIIRDIMFAQKGWATIDENELAKRFGEIRFKMIIWGGQDTIRAITALEDASATADMGRLFAASANLYAKIRKELGHSDDRELPTDLFLSHLILEDRQKVRELLDEGRKPKTS